MPVSCKNCDTVFNGNYCPYCGQSARTERITLRFILHDLQTGVIYLDRGILYTIKELFTRPGPAIKEYLAGKRIRHYKPISLLLILSTIYIFLYHYFNIEMVKMEENAEPGSQLIYQAGEWIQSHFAITELLFLPIFSLITYIFLYKYGYNYFEHIIINTFLGCQSLTLKILSFPVLLQLNLSFEIYVSRLILLAGYLLLIWTFFGLYKNHNKLVLLIITTFMLLLTYVLTALIIYYLVFHKF